MTTRRLGVGFIGSGFNARFHIQAWTGVRDADVLGVWSPNHSHAEEACALARKLAVGNARPYKSIGEMVADPAIDAIWLTGPNHARDENVHEIVDVLKAGKGELKGIACEKPLARTVKEA
jgi:predicted dehydrogenase